MEFKVECVQKKVEILDDPFFLRISANWEYLRKIAKNLPKNISVEILDIDMLIDKSDRSRGLWVVWSGDSRGIWYWHDMLTSEWAQSRWMWWGISLLWCDVWNECICMTDYPQEKYENHGNRQNREWLCIREGGMVQGWWLEREWWRVGFGSISTRLSLESPKDLVVLAVLGALKTQQGVRKTDKTLYLLIQWDVDDDVHMHSD